MMARITTLLIFSVLLGAQTLPFLEFEECDLPCCSREVTCCEMAAPPDCPVNMTSCENVILLPLVSAPLNRISAQVDLLIDRAPEVDFILPAAEGVASAGFEQISPPLSRSAFSIPLRI